MTIDEKLLHFRTTTMDSARAKSNSILDEYTEALDTIYEDFKNEKERQANMKIQTETDRLRLDANRKLHLEQLQIRQTFSDHSKELRELLFTEVSNMLEEYMKTPAYLTWMSKHILKAKEFAGDDEIIIYIDPADAQLILALQEQTHTQLTVSPKPFFGGIRAILPKRQILIDYSFGTKLEEEKRNFTFGGNA